MKHPDKIDELYILDNNLNLLCNIKEFKKLEWTERLYEAGSFSLELDFKKITNTKSSDYNYYKTLYESIISSTKDGYYYPRFIITNADRGFTKIAYIQNYNFTEDNTLILKGEEFLQFLSKRYTIEKDYIPSVNSNDSCGIVMCKIINDNIQDKQTNIARFLVADENNNDVGEDIYVSCKTTDKLYDKLNTLAEAYEVGIEILFNPDDKKMYFHTFKNEKEKDMQKLKVLSEDDNNIISISLESDIDKLRNYCLIKGEDLDVIIDLRQDKEEEPALELVIKSNKKRGDYTLEEYRKILENEGREKLSKYIKEEAFEIEPIQNIKIDLGEYLLCKIDLGYGMIYKQIITSEIKHTIENGKYSREVSFGKVFNLKNELQDKLIIME